MNRRERETRTWLVVLATAPMFGFLPLERALIGTVVVLLLAGVGSVVYVAVTFERHLDDALRVVRSGGVR